jgi:hypothetical protein
MAPAKSDGPGGTFHVTTSGLTGFARQAAHTSTSEDFMTGWTSRAARIAAGVTAAGFLLAGAAPAQAAGAAHAGAPPVAESFTILPTPAPGATKLLGAISLIVYPGHSYPESVSVINYARTRTKFWLYPADAYTIRKGGGFAVEPMNARPRDVGSWVSRLPKVITVPGRKQLNIRFSIRVPANAIPGQHAGGIVIEDTSPQLIRVNARLRVKRYTQVFTRLYLTVAGRVTPDFEIDGLLVAHPQPPFPLLTSRDGAISYYLSNTGNAILAPTVHVKVTDLFGTIMNKSYPQTSQILPGDLASYTVPWRNLPAIGPVHVYVTATSTYGLSRTMGYSYTAVPVPFVAAVALVVVLLMLALALVLRRRHHRAAGGRRAGRAVPDAASA